MVAARGVPSATLPRSGDISESGRGRGTPANRARVQVEVVKSVAGEPGDHCDNGLTEASNLDSRRAHPLPVLVIRNDLYTPWACSRLRMFTSKR